MNAALLQGAWRVYLKELLDALRDRRTLLVVFASSVALGPLVLVAISQLVAGMEKRAEARVIVVQGIEHAPALRNFLERQTYTVEPAPDNYEQLIRDGKLGDPVLVVPPGFATETARGEAPVVELFSSSSNQRVQAGSGRVIRLLQSYNQEQAMLRLAVRGVSAATLEAVQVEERDLSDMGARAAQFAVMLPYFVIIAVLYGALNAALDTTAGERERGSLEPLLMNPAPRWSLVLGKWGAVASVGMMIAVLSCMSFLPAQWLLRSDTLAAVFQFGLREALWFIGLLLPLAALVSALLMAIAIRCKSFKEAQANATVVILAVSLLPLVTMFNQQGTAPWHLWMPALAQSTLMAQVLKGETPAPSDLLLTLGVGAVVTLLALGYVVRMLRSAALK